MSVALNSSLICPFPTVSAAIRGYEIGVVTQAGMVFNTKAAEVKVLAEILNVHVGLVSSPEQGVPADQFKKEYPTAG